MLRHPNVLLFGNEEEEIGIAGAMLSKHANLIRAEGLPELGALLEGGNYDALFCSWSSRDGRWIEVLEEARHRNPNLPVIILSRTGGEKEWVGVLEAGGFDLLVPPYREYMVLALLEQAVASKEARDLGTGAGHCMAKASCRLSRNRFDP